MADKPIPFSAPMIRALLEDRKTQTRRQLKDVDPSYYGRFEGFVGIDSTKAVFTGLREKPWSSRLRYSVGDRLYVCEEHYRYGHWETVETARTKLGRQKWRFVEDTPEIRFDAPAAFRKGRHHQDPSTPAWHKRLGRFMFRKHSRLTLVVTDVRVERLSSITDQDAISEGATYRLECAGPELADIGWSMDWAPVDAGKAMDIDHCLTSASSAFLNYFYMLNKFPKKYGDDPTKWPDPWVAAYTFRVIKSNIDRVAP